jgi:hypothetical protein
VAKARSRAGGKTPSSKEPPDPAPERPKAEPYIDPGVEPEEQPGEPPTRPESLPVAPDRVSIRVLFEETPSTFPVLTVHRSKAWDTYDALAFLQAAVSSAGGSPGYDPGSPRDPVEFAQDLRKYLLAGRHGPSTPASVLVSFRLQPERVIPGQDQREAISRACSSVLTQLAKASQGVIVREERDLPGLAGVWAELEDRAPESSGNDVSGIERSKNIPPLSEAKLPKLAQPKKPRGRPPLPRSMRVDNVRQRSEEVVADLEQLQRDIVNRFQEYLNGLAGTACSTFAENQQVVEAVAEAAKRAGVTLLARNTRKDGDGKYHPVNIYCADPESKSGLFIATSSEGVTLTKGALFLQLSAQLGSVSSAPADQKSQKKRKSN